MCDNAVICPLHDRRYDLDTGAALNADDAVTAHSVQLDGERVLVTLTEGGQVAA